MRIAFPLLALMASAGCAPDNPRGVEEILGHRWARTLAECDNTYLRFSPSMIDFIRDGRSVSPLPVRRVVNGRGGDVMFVLEVDGALAPKTIAPRGSGSDVGMVFRISGDSLKLVDQGAPDRLVRGEVPGKNLPTFTLRRCPAGN